MGILFFRFVKNVGKYPSFEITEISRDAPNRVPLIAELVANNAPAMTKSVPQCPKTLLAPDH